MRSPRPLAPCRFHHAPGQRRPLPLLRRLPPQRSPAARPALPHAPPLPHRPPSPSSPSAIRRLTFAAQGSDSYSVSDGMISSTLFPHFSWSLLLILFSRLLLPCLF